MNTDFTWKKIVILEIKMKQSLRLRLLYPTQISENIRFSI